MRLIDVLKYADALEKIEQRLRQQAGEDIFLQKAINFISNAREYALQQPTIDPASLRPKGEWIVEENGVIVCSNCGEEHEWIDYRASFCEDCGADMRDSP